MRKNIVFGIGALIFGVTLYFLSDYILPTKIVNVHQKAIDFENTVFIVLKNPPHNNKAMLAFWDQNKDLIKKDYHVSLGNPKSIIFLKDAYKKYNKDTEDQYCFNSNFHEKSCIDKSQDILIISTLTGGMYSFSFSQPNCSFIENEDQKRSSLTCH